MGAIAALTFEDKVSFLRACGIITCGAAASTYANPVIMQAFHLPDSYGNAVAFMVGLVAMKIANLVLQAVAKIDSDLIFDLLTRFIPAKKEKSSKDDSTKRDTNSNS